MPPLLALAVLDYLVVGLFFIGLVALLVAEHFLAARTEETAATTGQELGPWLSGSSLAVAWLGAAGVALVSGDTFHIGWRWVLVPVAMIVALIPALWFVTPLFANLGVATPFAYLELRFGREARTLASLAYCLWRGLWLLALLVLPARLLAVAGLECPQWLTVLLLGAAGSGLAWVAGLRGIARFDVVAGALLLAAVVVVVGLVLAQTPGGWQGLWRAAGEIDRTELPDRGWRPNDDWALWTGLPALVVSGLAFYVVDQVSAQRWLAAGGVTAARVALTLQAFLTLSILVLAAIAGIGLCVLFIQQPDRLRPEWVVNIDPETGGSRLNPETGSPYLDFRGDRVDAATLPDLVAQRRLLRRNTAEPYESADGLIDAERNEIRVRELVMWRPSKGLTRRPEPILHRDARPEILPYTMGRLPWPLAGIGITALAAAAISAFAAGLVGLAQVLAVDLLERHDGLRDVWSERRAEPPGGWSPAARQSAQRALIAALGGAAILVAMVSGGRDDLAAAATAWAGVLAGPLVGLFTLGMLSKRATSLAVLIGFGAGVGVAMWVAAGASAPRESPLAVLWPWGEIAAGWALVAGLIATHAVGYALSWAVGVARPEAELQGLVIGRGELGQLHREPPPKIEIGPLPPPVPPGPPLPEPEKKRWKGSA